MEQHPTLVSSLSEARARATESSPFADQVVVIGAGPAGLTAAFELARRNRRCTVLEADNVVGGLSRTVERDGYRFDIGGHRFFTKVPRVERFWHEVLRDDEFLLRPRMSRILYSGKFYDYPLRAGNALRNLGVIEAIRCVASYLMVRIRPPKDQTKFEGWTAARFGWRLYRIFFKTYTEKVWGMPAHELQADWAAQRIKNLSLYSAIVNAILPKRNQTDITSLIEEFQYPRLGPGMMWERCRDKVLSAGSEVVLSSPVERLERSGGKVVAVISSHIDSSGQRVEVRRPCSSVISSMPFGQLLRAFDPPAPEEIRDAAKALVHRDFITVAVVVPGAAAFPDNWIYIHDPAVRVGRIQNFASWSPEMVIEGTTCLGLEYFVNEGDDLWGSTDDSLIELAGRDLTALGLVDAAHIRGGYVVRMPKAYPVYDATYQANVAMILAWLTAEAPNVFPVGRNGMHKYNNQDHSMYTAMLTVDNMFGATNDVWSVNVEQDYHEEARDDSSIDELPVAARCTDAVVSLAARSA